MLKFKIDIMETLKENGINTYKIRKDNLFGQKTLNDMKKGIVPGIKSIDTLCRVLDMQPGNIIKYVEEEEEKD